MPEEEINEEPMAIDKNKSAELTDEKREEKELEEVKKELVGKVSDTEISDALSDEEKNFKKLFKVVKRYPKDEELSLVTLEHDSSKFKEIADKFRAILSASGKVSYPDSLLLALVEVAQAEDTADNFYKKVTDHKSMVAGSLLEKFCWYFIIGLTKGISEKKDKEDK